MYDVNDKIICLVKEKYGNDISRFESSFLSSIIHTRISASGSKSIEDYTYMLQNQAQEYTTLLQLLTNSYSEFFRNPLTFDYLEQVVLPGIVENTKSKKDKEIRIWSAACASGQEAYSLAILCDELANSKSGEFKFRIFSTDINPDILSDAQKGVFQLVNLNKVTLKRTQTYFSQKGEVFSISPMIKNQVDFSVFDLLSEFESCPPASIYGNFDVIFCANLLFYYEPEYRQIILKKVKQCLNPDGFLVTGTSERDIVKANGFKEVFQNSAIFQPISRSN